jgi:putative FmdB family regulatory protein
VPTYSYACTACGHRFDAQQSFADASLTECPECSGRLRKLFGAVGVVFKGSGFYRTDSRSSGKTASIPATSSSANGSSSNGSANGSSSNGSASKPAAASSTGTSPAASAPAASA